MSTAKRIPFSSKLRAETYEVRHASPSDDGSPLVPLASHNRTTDSHPSLSPGQLSLVGDTPTAGPVSPSRARFSGNTNVTTAGGSSASTPDHSSFSSRMHAAKQLDQQASATIKTDAILRIQSAQRLRQAKADVLGKKLSTPSQTPLSTPHGSFTNGSQSGQSQFSNSSGMSYLS